MVVLIIVYCIPALVCFLIMFRNVIIENKYLKFSANVEILIEQLVINLNYFLENENAQCMDKERQREDKMELNGFKERSK